MIRRDLADELIDDAFAPGYVRPRYEDYCFANVTATAAAPLGVDLGRTLPDDALEGVVPRDDGPVAGDGTAAGDEGSGVGGEGSVAGGEGSPVVDNVVLVLVDGLRWDRWIDFHERIDLLGAASEHGTVTPLTATYPSETAAAITTLHTAAQPVEHGMLGWEQYLPAFGVAVEALPGRTLDDCPLSEVAGGTSAAAAALFEADPVYPDLREAGVEPVVVQPGATRGTPYFAATVGDATVRTYERTAEAAVEARDAIRDEGPTYVLAYHPEVDAMGHERGNDTGHYEAVLASVVDAYDRAFRSLDPDAAARTLLLVTADHGQIDPPRGTGIRPSDVDGVADNYQRDPDGNPIPPTGSARNVHFHLRDGTVAATRRAIEDRIDAHTWTREEAVAADLFGDREASETFLDRCGDLVVTPRDRVLWEDPSTFEMVGQHGGLSAEEILVPFAAVRADQLR